ncbi:MAG: Arc family DNA-binding protein [Rubripirellula sp.]|nr:Arc family DNA-binding protein [Rubripirellula sp.]
MPRESFLLRTDQKVLEALRKWADDELRSANGQLDYILRQALKSAGRLPKETDKKLRTNSKRN